VAHLADGRGSRIASWPERPPSPQRLAAGDVAFVGFEHVGEIGVQLGIIDAGQGFAQRAHHPALAAVEEVEALTRVLDRQQLVVEGAGGGARFSAEAGDMTAQHGAKARLVPRDRAERGAAALVLRSEERRVGKEWRSRWAL